MTLVLGLLRDWRVLAGIGLVASFGIWLAFHYRAVVTRHEANVAAKSAPARDRADAERVQDAVTNTRTEQELHHAIDTAPPGGAISPAAHALACQRLRHLGRIPPACRPEGSDGTQASAR
jgi:hypothetical protein